jgi:hypothetical protein
MYHFEIAQVADRKPRRDKEKDIGGHGGERGDGTARAKPVPPW